MTRSGFSVLQVNRWIVSVEVAPVMTLTHTPDGSTEIRMDGAIVAQLDGVADFSLNDIVLVPDAATDTQFVAGNYGADIHGTAGDDSLAGVLEAATMPATRS